MNQAEPEVVEGRRRRRRHPDGTPWERLRKRLLGALLGWYVGADAIAWALSCLVAVVLMMGLCFCLWVILRRCRVRE